MAVPNFDLYRKADYFADIAERINKTVNGDRVALATMSADVDFPLIEQLAASLGAAAQRGVRVSLAVDAYNFIKGREQFFGPLFWHAELPAQLHGEFAAKHSFFESLRAKGVTVAYTNIPRRAFSNPFAGRSHIKFAIINDRVYLGGCNIDDPNHVDMMIGWDDMAFADQLYDFSQQMVSAQGTGFMAGQDQRLELSPGMTVFIDAGKRRQSLILDQALKLIDEAQETLLITTQFFPNGETFRRLKAARQRGVKVTILFNHPSKFGRNERLPQYLNVAWARLREPAEFFANQLAADKPYLHAKIIATESAVMVGSHNYIRTGVNFGTAEIALLVRDAGTSEQIRNFITSMAQ